MLIPKNLPLRFPDFSVFEKLEKEKGILTWIIDGLNLTEKLFCFDLNGVVTGLDREFLITEFSCWDTCAVYKRKPPVYSLEQT